MRNGKWLQTFMGRAYYPTDPHPDDVTIIDIAHALSHICRYAGHCSTFYSVAEHSYLMSFMVAPEHALQALLHDATEAYIQDLPSPIKKTLFEYQAIEHLNRVVICKHFGIDSVEPPEVKQADKDILLSERAALFGSAPRSDWGPPEAVLQPNVRIMCYRSKEIKRLFLRRFDQLWG